MNGNLYERCHDTIHLENLSLIFYRKFLILKYKYMIIIDLMFYNINQWTSKLIYALWLCWILTTSITYTLVYKEEIYHHVLHYRYKQITLYMTFRNLKSATWIRIQHTSPQSGRHGTFWFAHSLSMWCFI